MGHPFPGTLAGQGLAGTCSCSAGQPLARELAGTHMHRGQGLVGPTCTVGRGKRPLSGLSRGEVMVMLVLCWQVSARS